MDSHSQHTLFRDDPTQPSRTLSLFTRPPLRSLALVRLQHDVHPPPVGRVSPRRRASHSLEAEVLVDAPARRRRVDPGRRRRDGAVFGATAASTISSSFTKRASRASTARRSRAHARRDAGDAFHARRAHARRSRNHARRSRAAVAGVGFASNDPLTSSSSLSSSSARCVHPAAPPHCISASSAADSSPRSPSVRRNWRPDSSVAPVSRAWFSSAFAASSTQRLGVAWWQAPYA